MCIKTCIWSVNQFSLFLIVSDLGRRAFALVHVETSSLHEVLLVELILLVFFLIDIEENASNESDQTTCWDENTGNLPSNSIASISISISSTCGDEDEHQDDWMGIFDQETPVELEGWLPPQSLFWICSSKHGNRGCDSSNATEENFIIVCLPCHFWRVFLCDEI